MVYTWSETRSGKRKLRITRSCSSSSRCTEGWNDGWPYTDSYDDDSSNGLIGADYSDFDDDEDDTEFRYYFRYNYKTIYTGCEPVVCRRRTGNSSHALYLHTMPGLCPLDATASRFRVTVSIRNNS